MAVTDVNKTNPNNYYNGRTAPQKKNNILVSAASGVPPAPNYSGVLQAMTQTNPTLSQGPSSSSPSSGTVSPYLPSNYNFDDLAGYETAKRNNFTTSLTDQLAKRRAELSKSLTDQGTDLFNANLPDINEGLNNNGVFTSPTANAKARADALSKIAISNNSYFNDFDNAALSTTLQSQQDALDTELGLRGNKLESQLQEGQANREEALARDLAKKQSRNNLTNSLIGGGGSILGGLFAGGGGGLFGGGSAAAAGFPAATGAGAGGVPLAGAGGAGAGGIGLGGGAAIAAAGYGSMKMDDLTKSLIAKKSPFGNSINSAGRYLSNPIGSQLNFAKSVISNPKQAISKALGQSKSHTDTKGSDAWMQNMDPNEVAQKLGTSVNYAPSFDSNNAGSYERNYNAILQNFSPDQLVARYSTVNPGILTLPLDKQYKQQYDQAKAQVGRDLTPEEAAQVFGRYA